MLHEVRFSAGQLFLVPVMDRDGLGSRCKVIPQVFYELELLRWAQIKDGDRGWVHLSHSCYGEKKCSYHRLDCISFLPWAEVHYTRACMEYVPKCESLQVFLLTPWHCRSRNTGYLTVPAQIPAHGFPTTDS